MATPSHMPSQSSAHEPLHDVWTSARPSHVAWALHSPAHSPVSCAGEQRVVMSPGVHVSFEVHADSHLTSASSSTVQCAGDTKRLHCAWARDSTALILADAWWQASVTSSSGCALPLGAFADHVSFTPRSWSIPVHAARTTRSPSSTRATRFAVAITKAFVSPSIDSDSTDEGPPDSSLQPDARPSALLTALSAALHPPDANRGTPSKSATRGPPERRRVRTRRLVS